jgi:hypothetical protein
MPLLSGRMLTGRGPAAIEAIIKHRGPYLIAVGAAVYLISKSIRSARVVAFEDLGMEVIHELEVEDMPVTLAVDVACRSIHPERFLDPLDASFVVQPLRVNVNTKLGRPSEERFFPVEYDRLIAVTQSYFARGLLKQLMDISRPLPVVAALLAGALHEIRIAANNETPNETNLGAEVKSSVLTLIDFLNRGATTKREPMPW